MSYYNLHRSPHWYEESGREMVFLTQSEWEWQKEGESKRDLHNLSPSNTQKKKCPLPRILLYCVWLHTHFACAHFARTNVSRATCCEDVCSKFLFSLRGEDSLFFLLYVLYKSLDCWQKLRHDIYCLVFREMKKIRCPAAILYIQYNQISNWVWCKLTYTCCFCTVCQTIINSSVYCFLCQIDPKQN